MGDLVLDRGRHRVTVRGEQVPLSPKEFAILDYLARHRGQVLTRDEILAEVWGGTEFITEHTVDVHVRWLREKIEKDPAEPSMILTVRGEGYKLVG